MNTKTEASEEFSYELKIPEERVAVLIGAAGGTKKEIERETKCKLDITKEGDVTIIGDDGLLLFTTKEIVRSIARGFNPRLALLLLKQDYVLEIIDMKDVAGKSKSTLERLKGRVIGTGGKARAEIERLTGTHISIYGKTIGIIGECGDASLAREAMVHAAAGFNAQDRISVSGTEKKEILFGQTV